MTQMPRETRDTHKTATQAANPDSGQVTWRLLLHGPATGAQNMAVDEAIGRGVAEGVSPPTLRFYAWDPPCVSLGRHQPLADVDQTRCDALGYGIVRRPTGGRAILHTDELTYSIIAPPDHPVMAGKVLDAYLRLASGLVSGLNHLSVPAHEAPGTNRAGRSASAVCFEIPSAYEIVVGGKKLLGSAQSRRNGYVLQHGTLPLFGDLTRLIDCLVFESESQREALRTSLHGHATTVEAVLGRTVSFEETAAALIAGFGEALGLVFADGELNEAERAWTAELVGEKYGHPDWTAQV